jgi:hypothetical protein
MVALYIRILLRSAQAPPTRENAKEYLDLLESLSMTEVEVAAAVYRVQRDVRYEQPKEKVAFDKLVQPEHLEAELPGLSADLIDAYLKRLESTGLVREETRGIGNPGRMYHVTDYFRTMMAYLDMSDLTEGL